MSSEKTKKRLLYAMIFVTAGIVLVIEPLSYILGFGHGDGHSHGSVSPTPHTHEPGESGNHAH